MHPQDTAHGSNVVALRPPITRLIDSEVREHRLTRASNTAIADMRAAAGRLRTLSWAHDAIDPEHITEFEDIIALIAARADQLETVVNQ